MTRWASELLVCGRPTPSKQRLNGSDAQGARRQNIDPGHSQTRLHILGNRVTLVCHPISPSSPSFQVTEPASAPLGDLPRQRAQDWQAEEQAQAGRRRGDPRST